jgi:hypothetical protein
MDSVLLVLPLGISASLMNSAMTICRMDLEVKTKDKMQLIRQ